MLCVVCCVLRKVGRGRLIDLVVCTKKLQGSDENVRGDKDAAPHQMPTCDVSVHSPIIVAHLFVCPTRPSQLVSRHHPASVALPIPCRTAVTFCDAPPTCRSSEEQSRDASTFQPSPRLEAPRHLAAGHVGHARGLSCLWPYRADGKRRYGADHFGGGWRRGRGEGCGSRWHCACMHLYQHGARFQLASPGADRARRCAQACACLEAASWCFPGMGVGANKSPDVRCAVG